jgi:anti-sigma regulatory factor (Ser/Thr protein kinase)
MLAGQPGAVQAARAWVAAPAGNGREATHLAPPPRQASEAPVTAQIPLEEPARPGDDAEAAAMLDQGFTVGTLHILRESVLAHATAAGLPEARATDVMLAVHELADNAVRHGGGTGQLRVRIAAGKLHCQVTDPGNATANGYLPTAPASQGSGPAAQPWPYQPGHGLWLVRRAADQLTATTGPRGSQVTVSFTLPDAP